MTFSARWTLFKGEGYEMLSRQKAEIVKPGVEENDYPSIVYLKSEALADFCREIAAAIEGLKQETDVSPDEN